MKIKNFLPWLGVDSTRLLKLFSLIIALSVLGLQSADAQCDHPDYDALIELYNSTEGANWTNNSGWAEGAAGTRCDPCAFPRWYGVACENGRVTILNLSDNNLTGSLPASLSDVLVNVNFSKNNLEGNIPELHEGLRVINLALNDLTGTIPALPSSLISLDARNNKLTGMIPTLPDGLTNLSLSRNRLMGEIPELPGGLQRIVLANNRLTGEIPVLPLTLTAINLENNMLSGCFPASLQPLCGLDLIFLSGNSGLPDGGSAEAVAEFCATNGGDDSDGDGIVDFCDPFFNLDLPVEGMIAFINELDLNNGQKNSLITKLELILTRYCNGNTNAARNQLNAFINEVKGLENGGVLTSDQAAFLLAMAQEIMDAFDDPETMIECPDDDLRTLPPTERNLTTEPVALQLYPNPAVDFANLRLYAADMQGEATIRIFDNLGRLMSTYRIAAGEQTLRLDLPSTQFASGLYFIRAEIGDEVYTERLLIAR